MVAFNNVAVWAWSRDYRLTRIQAETRGSKADEEYGSDALDAQGS